MTRLMHQPDRLQPAEDVLHPFALALAERIAWMVHRAAIDRAGASVGVLRHMGRDVQLPKLEDEVARVVTLVRAQGDPLMMRQACGQLQRDVAFGRSRRRRRAGIDDQAMPVLDQHVAHVVELGFSPRSFAVQAGLRICRGRMRRIAPRFPVKVHGRIARVVRWRSIRRVFGAKAFEARPGLDQGAIGGEVLVRQQVAVYDDSLILNEDLGS